MFVRMTMNDPETFRDVEVGQGEIEYLGDVAELFLTFLHAAGYSYVTQVIIDKGNGDTVETMK
jgi:hypothetical protein